MNYLISKNKNKYRIKDNYVFILLENKKGICLETKIDIGDFDLILDNKLKWRPRLDKGNNQWYPVATSYYYDESGNKKGTTISLHRLILDSVLIDHIDRDTLNNSRENLRIANKSLNAMNRKSKNSNNTSGYRNVTKMGKYWRVQLQIGGTNCLFPEKFENADDAGKFAEDMRSKYYGEFAGEN